MSSLSFTLYTDKTEEHAFVLEAFTDGNSYALANAVVSAIPSGLMRYQSVQVSSPIYASLDDIGFNSIGEVSCVKSTTADAANVVNGTWLWTFTIPQAVAGIPAGTFTAEEFLQNYNISVSSKTQMTWSAGVPPVVNTVPDFTDMLVNPSEYVASTSCGTPFPLSIVPETSSGAYANRKGTGFKVKAGLASCTFPSTNYCSYSFVFDKHH